MMNGKSKKLQQEILCGEKLSVNIFYIRVREYKSRHNLSEVQNPREMLLSHADGEKLKSGCVAYHLRRGGHSLSVYDWDEYINYADKVLK